MEIQWKFFRESVIESEEEEEEEEQYSPLPRSTLSATAPEYNGNVIFQSNILPPLPEDSKDILLSDCVDENDWKETERCLTEEIGYAIKLLICKTISSDFPNSQKYFSCRINLHVYFSFLVVLPMIIIVQ